MLYLFLGHQPPHYHSGFSESRNSYRFHQNHQTRYDSTDDGEDEYCTENEYFNFYDSFDY